jgi:hypothetical protein
MPPTHCSHARCMCVTGVEKSIARLITGAQDYYGRAVEFEIRLDIPLKEIRKGDKEGTYPGDGVRP